MSLPSADTADLWMRKNIAEVTDPETGAKSYEADEAYMRTTATEAEITADFDAWYETASAWQPPVPEKKPDTQEGRITALEVAVEKLKQGTGTPADVSKIERAVTLFPAWAAGVAYTAGTKVKHGGVLYSVLQDHTSQASWEPGVAPSLFAKVLIPDPDAIPEWEQPDSTNAYKKGDKVRFEGKVYKSLIDNNVWSPSAYPAGWQQIKEG